MEKPDNKFFLRPKFAIFVYEAELCCRKARRGRSAFADGYGMAWYVSRDAATGEMQFQYCLCPWKRGSRHGDGIIQFPDGTVLKARWNWDQLNSLSDQVPSEEELEEFSRRLTRLETVLRLLGWNNRY